MKIGIISDTHDDITNTNKAIDIFEHNKVEVVIHAGDMISPPVIKEFKRLTENGVKFFGIFGNNDGEKVFEEESQKEEVVMGNGDPDS